MEADLATLCVLITLLLGVLPAGAQLNERCTVSILNRTAQVKPDGTWIAPNVPVNFGQVRARATCVENGVTRSGQSDLFTIPANGSVTLSHIPLGAAAPIIVGAVDTPGTAKGVAVSGNVAVIADGFPSSAVRIIDVTNPVSPQILGSVAIPGDAKDVVVRDTLAYVAAFFGGFWIVDFSTPANPQIVGSLPSSFRPRDGELSERFALFADNIFPNAVPIVDVSIPTSPVFRAILDFSPLGAYAGTGSCAR